jgi:hypothetical protein
LGFFGGRYRCTPLRKTGQGLPDIEDDYILRLPGSSCSQEDWIPLLVLWKLRELAKG